MHLMAALGNLPKLKRGLVLAFGAHFLHDFSIKNVPYLILSNLPSFNIRPYFLLKMSLNVCF